MIKVKASDLAKLRLEVDALATTAFWLETYAMGLKERARRMKDFLLTLESVAIPDDQKVISKVNEPLVGSRSDRE